ncbi:hypothetical protein AMAG_02499 [Allomyces macrogynus ATCC 38327]|uniref:Uncharacterized protein n=1 Tax=Allomyces macrogynus (strain ATCC 38327) TaxID=578462 RepID=A0A0L0S2T9_ALLM3|nr:hypothetical protein AMAG_02499 [Allomyces macrogynus ATCC 38327]|eukprot:KNE56720.1 hypothetical protein AMAG_02499 [Allomyces macrogynus ATCC 38327]
MEDLIDFVIRETALEGARGASLPRLWHFVQCFLNGTSVHPSARYVPPPPTVTVPEPLPAADDAATPQLPLAAPARDWTPPLDKPYQTYVWAQLVDEVHGGAGKLRICQVRTVQHRVVSRKSAAQKRRAAVSAEALAHVSAVAAAANDGDDGTLVTTVHEATPLADEDLGLALDALVDKYGEELRLVVPEQHRRTMVVGEGFSIASKQIYSVLEEIVRWRAVGITQAELSKQLGFDPRSTFHYIKTLAAKHRIVKFPVVHRGNYTQLTLAAQFAHLNDAYMATLAGAAKDIANGPSTAGSNPTPPLPAAAATAGPDGAAAAEEDDDLDDLEDDDEDAIRLTETVKCTFLFFNGGTGAATDASGANDAAVAAADHAAGAAADAAARAPETKPGLFAALVRAQVVRAPLLSLAPNQMLVAEDLIHALGLQPAQYPRQRKWFNRTVADLVQRGHVQRVHAPKAEGHGRGFVNCIRLLKPYTLSRRKTMPTLLADDAGDDVVMGESSASAATANAAETTVASPDAAAAAAAANADARSPAGILADLPFEYQVHRLLAAAGERGMTGRQLRRHLGNIAARPFNKCMERLIVLPGKPAPPPPPPGAKHTALTLQRMPEIRGRERRYRYYTNEAMLAKQANDPELKALFAAQQEKQMASLVAVRKLALGEGGATAVTEPATPARGAEGAAGDAMDVDAATPEVPATPVPASSSAAASVAATPVTLSLRTSLESLRRANAIMALVRQYRIVEINHIFIRQIQDILTADVPPVTTGADPAPASGWQLDKKTVLRSLETLQREKLVELKWIGIPMLSGGMDRKQFAVVVDAANPVTDQEINDKAREVEREILYGPAEPAWISSSARENGGTPSRSAPPVIATPMVPSARTRRRSTRGATTATAVASTPMQPNASGMTASAAAAAAADAAPHWRVVATEYGWLDARMLRVKYLYQYLHEQTRDAGPEYAFDITVLFSDMTLGMYLQLIGHIIQSPALTEYMEHHLDTPLRNVRDDIRAELLGTDRLKRRFRFHVTHMINVLVALNVVVAPDEPELYKTVTEMTLPKRIYRVPRQIDLLDYLAPRSERSPVGTRDLTEMTEVAEFWTELELLRAPQTTSAGPRSRSSSKGGDDDDPDADVDADDADEPDDDLRRPNRQSVLNPEADPIKLLTLPRNWRPPHTYTREQRRALTAVCDPDHGTTPLQHDPACRELARKTGLHINRVKQFFRRFEWDWAQKRARQAGAAGAAVNGGGESVSERDTVPFAWPTRRGASVSPAEPRPASPGTSLIGRLQAKRMQKRAAVGTPTPSSSSVASSPAVGAAASTGTTAAAPATKQRTASGTAGSAPGMPDRRHRKRTLQQINADGDVEVVRQKRTRFQWTETEDARLVASWVICTHQVQQRRARAVAWRLMAHMFSGRPIDSLRRRATALLKRPDVLVRTKVLERVWAAHMDECDECEDVDNHEELECAVAHLLAINIDEAAASAPIVEEIPDSVEDLLAQFEVVADPVPLLVDLVDNELTARSKLVHMYENALYVPHVEPCSRQMVFLEDDGEKAGTPTTDQEPDEAAADAEVAAVTRPATRSTRLRSPTRLTLPPAVADRQVAVVAQFLKMICLTPDAEYNSATAFGMLHAYPSHIVERALTQAQDSGALVRMRSATKTRVVPGRTVALSDRFRVQLYGHPTQRQIMAAVQCVTDLGAHIARAGADVQTFTLDELVDEGVMMAVIDLVVGGHAHMRVRVALPTVWAAPIVPAHARDADMHLPVEVSARRADLPAPQITWPADGQAPVLSTSKRLVRRVRRPDGSVRVRVGQEGHVLVDPTNDEAMAQVCLRRLPDHIAADPMPVNEEEGDEDPVLAAAEAALRKWMVPRIWTSIRGHVVPAIVRSAMTALLSFLVKYPGAPLTWVVERFELCLLKTEIIELLEMLEARGAVETAEVDGEVYVYVLSGYFAKVL